MACGATRPMKLMMPTKETASALAAVQTAMPTSVTARTLTPRLEAVSLPAPRAL